MPTTPMTSWVLNTGTPRCPCDDSRECQSCPERESQDDVYVVLDSAAKDKLTCTAEPFALWQIVEDITETCVHLRPPSR